MTMLGRYRNLAVKHKLRLIILSAVAAALIPTSIAVVGYDQVSARREMRSDLDVLAEIVGSNSTAAVTFGDSRTAEELLSGLKAKKHIVTAVIFSDGRQTVRELPPDGRAGRCRCFPGLEPGRRAGFEGDRLIVYRDIWLASQVAGVDLSRIRSGGVARTSRRASPGRCSLILLISFRSGDGAFLQAPARRIGTDRRIWRVWPRAFRAKTTTPCGRPSRPTTIWDN